MGSIKKNNKSGRSNRWYSGNAEFETRFENGQYVLYRNNRFFKYLPTVENLENLNDQLSTRIQTLEDNETIYQIYEFVGQSETGTLTLPEEAAIFDLYGDGIVDAIMVEADENGAPTDTNSINSLGDVVLIQSIGATGAWSTINGAPTNDSCIIYFIVINDAYKANVPLINQVSPGIKGLLSINTNATLEGDGRSTTPLQIAGLSSFDDAEVGQVITVNSEKIGFQFSGVVSSNPIQLKAVSKLDQTISTYPATSVVLAEVTQESNGISIDNGVITFGKTGFYRIQVQLNINNANNTHFDTWTEYWDGDSWEILPDSGNHFTAANADVGQFNIESTFTVGAGTMLRLVATVETGSATLDYDVNTNGVGNPAVTFLAYEINPIVIGISKETNNLIEDFYIGQEANGNSTRFEPDGTVVSEGGAIVWDEVSTSLIGRNIYTSAGAVDYNFDELTVDFSTSSRYPTDNVGMVMQMPHRRDSNTNIRPHIHWIQNEDTNPNILIAYRTCNNGDVYSAWTLKALLPSDNKFTFTTIGQQQITEFNLPTTVGESLGLSGTFECKIYRDYTNASGLFTGADTYVGDWSVKYYDIHFLVNMFGSREEFIK